jgi:hypothetical protein
MQRRSTRRRGRRSVVYWGGTLQPCHHEARLQRAPLQLEALETRSLPSVTTWPGLLHPIAEIEPNDTLDQAQNLGDLSTTPRAEVIGSISNSSGGGVDWYSFTLDSAASVSISAPKASGNASPVTTISLYNSDPGDSNDPYDPLGYRLLEQADSAVQPGTAQVAQASSLPGPIERRLAPGTYYVAVSGSGNHYFNPFLADSGYPGATGDYGLLITAADLGIEPTDGPAVLAADPQPGATLDRSPFLIRVDLSEPLDPNTVSAGGTIQLISNINGTFGDGNDETVNSAGASLLANASLNTAGNELLLAPSAPLTPGYYKVVLAGNTSTNSQVLADLNGVALGTSSSQLSGADFTFTFQIAGNEGLKSDTPDDTPSSSQQLGDITHAGLVQIAGAIGDDSTDSTPFDGSQVDLYHFQLSGSGHYAFTAEVFAGRIGSPLPAGVSLFQANPASGKLSLIGSNAGTQNNTVATNGFKPLASDPLLYAGLRAGDYYLAVTNVFNVPDPVNSPPGTDGVFDPTMSHSGQNGGPTGDYVVNLHVQSIPNPPQVVAVTPNEGTILDAPPTLLTVQFSEPVNLQELAFQSSVQNVTGTVGPVFVQGMDGSKYYPSLDSYDATTNRATFRMNDGLGNGSYQLHLSGPLGLTDLAGNALVSNDASGDYVVHFTVEGPPRGTGSTPDLWSDQEPNDDAEHPQDLGVLFRQDLKVGVTLQRDYTQDPANAPADAADNYRFQILEFNNYIFNFTSFSLPPGTQATLLDASGTPVNIAPQPHGPGFSAQLQPGSYVLQIGGWTPDEAAGVNYTIVIKLDSNFDNPMPLTAGPAPAISIQPVSTAPPSPPPAPVVVSPPPPPTTPTPTPPPPGVATGPVNPPTAPVVATPPASADPIIPVPTAPGTVATGATSTLVTTGTATVTGTTAPVANNSPPPATVPSLPAGPADLPTAVLAGAAPVAPQGLPSRSVVTATLVAPTGISNSGATPAVLRTTLDRPTESGSLPSGILLALGTSPVGSIKDPGAKDSSPPAERVFVQLPDLASPRQPHPALDLLVRADSATDIVEVPTASPLPTVDTSGLEDPIFFQSTLATPPHLSQPDAGASTTVFSLDLHQLVNSSSRDALDVLFGMARWLRAIGSPSTPLTEDNSTTEEAGDYENRSVTLLRCTQHLPDGAPPPWAKGMKVVAAVAAAISAEYQRSEVRRHRDAQFWRKHDNRERERD